MATKGPFLKTIVSRFYVNRILFMCLRSNLLLSTFPHELNFYLSTNYSEKNNDEVSVITFNIPRCSFSYWLSR